MPPWPLDDDVPTGADPETVEQFFTWLYRHYVRRMPNSPGDPDGVLGLGPEWEMQWLGPFLQEVVVGVVLIAFFGAFAYWFNHPTRPSNGMYKPVVYDRIYERHGKPNRFGRLVYLSVTLWAGYYAVSHIVFGQVY